MSNHQEKNIWHKYGIVLVSIFLATVITFLFPLLSGGMYFLFLTAIVFSTLYGGLRAGILSAVLSVAICALFLRRFPEASNNFADWLVLLTFAAAASMTILLCYAQLRSESARKNAEDKYRLIFEDAITGIYETTLDGKYVAANPKLAEIFGYDSPSQMIAASKNLNLNFYVESNQRAKFIDLVEKNENISGFESEILRRDGTKTWISENALAVRNKSGNLIGFQGTTIEITARKTAEAELQKAHEELEQKVAARTSELAAANQTLRGEIAERQRVETALRASQEKFRSIVEVVSDCIWEADAHGVYTYISHKVKEVAGYEPAEMLGKTPYDLMMPEEARRVINYLKPIVAARQNFIFLENVNQHKNGEQVVTETSGIPVFDSSGNYCGYRGVVSNITKRKHAEIALRESELRLRSVVTASQIILFALDRNGNFTLSEGKGLESLGLQASEVVGQSVYNLYSNSPKIIADVKRALRGANFTNTTEINNLVFETRYTPVFDENKTFAGTIGVAIDITERKQIENELLTSQKQLRELSGHLQSVREQERKHIARELHDELGQTLTALKIDLVRLGEKTKIVERQLSTVQIARKISAMLVLIDTAMETTRKIVSELRPGVLDELGLAAAMEWQVRDFQRRTGIRCELAIDFDENRVSQDLITAIFRILQECLTNIARHSGAKSARFVLKDEEHRIFFEAEDNGRGISAQEASGSRTFGILGMRERTILLGGMFEINEVETGGTRVTVKIPHPLQPTKTPENLPESTTH